MLPFSDAHFRNKFYIFTNSFLIQISTQIFNGKSQIMTSSLLLNSLVLFVTCTITICTNLSTLMAHRLSMDAVQSSTSSDIQMSQSTQPRRQEPAMNEIQ